MYTHGQELEVTGELTEISPRFYANGWGYGTLRADTGRQLKITGTLEGRTTGERLIVRGTWSTDSKYGPQLVASIVTPDIKNGTTSSIKSWFRKLAKATTLFGHADAELAERLMEACDNVCGFVDAPLRWDTLSSEAALVALGIPDAALIAEQATKQLKLYRKVVELQSWGFIDSEIHKLGDLALEISDAAGVYGLVEPPVALPFYRVDSIAQGAWDVEALADMRIAAGVYFTLKKVQEDGHTAASLREAVRLSSETLQLYPSHLYEWLAYQDLEEGAIRLYERDRLQLRETHRYEKEIAQYVLQRVKDATDP